MLRRNRPLKAELLEPRRLFSGQPWLEDSGQQLGANAARGVALDDLDGDGNLDALVGCYNAPDFRGCDEITVWLGDGEGHLTSSWNAPAGAVLSVALADLDGDGDRDMFIGKGSPGPAPAVDFRNEVWLNDGHGNFTDSGQQLGRGRRTFDVRLGDLDRDGDLDALVANAVGGTRVWLNDGQAIFTDTEQSLGSDVLAAALGDLDGDGDLDAYITHRNSSDRVWLNDGEGNFTDSGQRLGRRWANGVQLADLDGDGDLDAFVANGLQDHSGNGVQPNEVWLNDGSGNFTDSGQRLGGAVSMWVELGDIDGDGDPDAYVANGYTIRPRPDKVWLNDGAGVFTEAEQNIGVPGGFAVSLGDIDDDGDLDALVGRARQDNQLWLNVPPVPGDANRDGQFDPKDIVEVLQAGKYNTQQLADWGEGDWNGDGLFDQDDIVTALQTGNYLRGPYAIRVIDTVLAGVD